MEMPDFVPHTVVRDVHSAVDELVMFHLGDSFQISELMAGEDVTIFVNNGVCGVEDGSGVNPAGAGSAVSVWLEASGLSGMLTQFEAHVGRPFVIQGTVIGPEFSGGQYDLEENSLVVTNILDLNERFQLSPTEVQWFVSTFNESPEVSVKLSIVHSTVYTTPFIPAARLIAMNGGRDEAIVSKVKADLLDDLSMLVGGISSMFPTKERAGLVFRSMNTEFVFKIEKGSF